MSIDQLPPTCTLTRRNQTSNLLGAWHDAQPTEPPWPGQGLANVLLNIIHAAQPQWLDIFPSPSVHGKCSFVQCNVSAVVSFTYACLSFPERNEQKPFCSEKAPVNDSH